MKQNKNISAPTYDNTSQMYDYVCAFFYGFVQSINYTYDEYTIKIGELLSFTKYTYDASGTADQFIQYMPLRPTQGIAYGEQFIDQRSTGHDIRFKFTGKERDAETGLDYFGARYYDSDISVWLSVDPLADKYPSMSPFMYVAGNPVKLIDPDGMRISGGGEKGMNPELKKEENNSAQHNQSSTGNTTTNTSKSNTYYGNGNYRYTEPVSKNNPSPRVIRFFGLANKLRRKLAGHDNTHNWVFGLRRHTYYTTKSRWRTVAQGNTNTGPINYTSRNPYEIEVNLSPAGSAISGTLNGQPINLFNSRDSQGRGLDSRRRLMTTAINTGPAGDNYSIVFPISVRYTWTAKELINFRKRHSFYLPSIWHE